MPEPTDPVLVRARRLQFAYDEDPTARRELERRLAAVGRREEVITYSDLVKGVLFQLPNVQGDRPIELGVPEWADLHRAIIGSNLGRISCDSYQRAGFLASALAVSKETMEPSEGFRLLLEEIGLVGTKRDDAACTRVWLEHVRKAFAWLASNPQWPDA